MNLAFYEEQYEKRRAAAYSGELREDIAQYLRDTYHIADCLIAKLQSPKSLDTRQRVCFYEQDFYVLSNFSSFRIEWMGHDFDTSEHAYHWEKFKTTNTVAAHRVRNARSAHDAFKIAESNKGTRRSDWDEVKVDIMRKIIRAKVEQHEYVRRKLNQTGDRQLVENSWRDAFWGWGSDFNGQNILGKLWMELREELRMTKAEGLA